MANTVRFIFRNPKETKTEQSIYIAYNFDRNRKLFYSTGLKVKPNQWNNEKQKVTSSTAKNKDIFNNKLNEIRTNLEKYIYECQNNNEPISHEHLKNFLNKYFNPEKYNKPIHTLFEFIEDFIKKSETRINPKTGKHIGYKTIREYARTFHYLTGYSQNRKNKLDFKDIDLNFYYDFIDYLQSLELATNTIGHKILTLKTFLNDATDRNINTNLAFKSPKFQVLKEDSEDIYLNETELKTIYNHDFSKNKKLESTRDIFIFAAYVGQRFGDWKNFSANVKNGFLNVIQEKTGNKVLVPLLPLAKNILEKYNYKLPKIISNQKFNEYLKEVCRTVGINEITEKKRTKGGKRITYKKEKWELVGTHTARRSFATNMYKLGLPTITIMTATGHKTETSFLKYIKVTPEEHANLMLEKYNELSNK